MPHLPPFNLQFSEEGGGWNVFCAQVYVGKGHCVCVFFVLLSSVRWSYMCWIVPSWVFFFFFVKSTLLSHLTCAHVPKDVPDVAANAINIVKLLVQSFQWSLYCTFTVSHDDICSWDLYSSIKRLLCSFLCDYCGYGINHEDCDNRQIGKRAG